MTEFRYQKDDQVEVIEEFLDTSTWDTIRVGEVGTVSSIKSKNYVNVRFPDHMYVITFNAEKLAPVDAERKAELAEAEKQYQPGPGDITPDDPRIQWLWRAAGRHAERAGHCREYDNLCAELDIPGRERAFKVKVQVQGLKLTTEVKAQSKKLAETAVLAKMPGAELV
jgi:hypothetical protein